MICQRAVATLRLARLFAQFYYSREPTAAAYHRRYPPSLGHSSPARTEPGNTKATSEWMPPLLQLRSIVLQRRPPRVLGYHACHARAGNKSAIATRLGAVAARSSARIACTRRRGSLTRASGGRSASLRPNSVSSHSPGCFQWEHMRSRRNYWPNPEPLRPVQLEGHVRSLGSGDAVAQPQLRTTSATAATGRGPSSMGLGEFASRPPGLASDPHQLDRAGEPSRQTPLGNSGGLDLSPTPFAVSDLREEL